MKSVIKVIVATFAATMYALKSASALTRAIGNQTSTAAAPASPAVNFASEWLDELGCICPKYVDYASQYPKGHVLVSFTGVDSGTSARRLVCRVCHAHAESERCCHCHSR